MTTQQPIKKQRSEPKQPADMTVSQLAKRIDFLKRRIAKDQKEKVLLAEHLTANINN